MNIKKIVGWSVAGLLAVILAFSSFVVVPYGNVGVPKTLGKLSETTLDEGFHIKAPFIQTVIKQNVQVQKAEAKATAVSKDIQTVTTDVTVNYSVEKDAARDLLNDVGKAYESKVVAPAVQETIKAVVARYTAEQLVTKRDIVSGEIKDALTKRLQAYGFKINEINIVEFAFSEVFNNSIEAKQVAAQNALKAENDLTRIKTEKQQKITQAEAEAESLRLKKQEITPELVELKKIEIQEKAIEAWDGKLPTTTGGAVPFIDVTATGK